MLCIAVNGPSPGGGTLVIPSAAVGYRLACCLAFALLLCSRHIFAQLASRPSLPTCLPACLGTLALPRRSSQLTARFRRCTSLSGRARRSRWCRWAAIIVSASQAAVVGAFPVGCGLWPACCDGRALGPAQLPCCLAHWGLLFEVLTCGKLPAVTCPRLIRWYLCCALCSTPMCALPTLRSMRCPCQFQPSLTRLLAIASIHSLQYPDVRTADTAKQALEGHAMYDGGHNVVSFHMLDWAVLAFGGVQKRGTPCVGRRPQCGAFVLLPGRRCECPEAAQQSIDNGPRLPPLNRCM